MFSILIYKLLLNLYFSYVNMMNDSIKQLMMLEFLPGSLQLAGMLYQLMVNSFYSCFISKSFHSNLNIKVMHFLKNTKTALFKMPKEEACNQQMNTSFYRCHSKQTTFRGRKLEINRFRKKIFRKRLTHWKFLNPKT